MSATGVLCDVRVIDMCHGLAGPSATGILVSLGADVIKVEMPGSSLLHRAGVQG